MLRAVFRAADAAPFDGTAMGCRILAAVGAYGFAGEVPVWRGDDFLLAGAGDAALFCGEAKDPGEVESFLCFLGSRVLVSTGQTFGFSVLETGALMCLRAPLSFPVPEGETPCFLEQAPKPEDPPLSALYALLSESEDETLHFSAPPYDAFLLDTSRRLRRGTRVGAALRGPDGAFSACVFADISPKSLFLFSGAVAPKKRGQGRFAGLLAALSARVARESCFLFCVEPLCRYYTALGFQRAGSFFFLDPKKKADGFA